MPKTSEAIRGREWWRYLQALSHALAEEPRPAYRWNDFARWGIATGGCQRGAIISNSLLINAVGVAAAVCSMASFIPQAVKIIRARDASSVSLYMYVVTVVGFSLWAGYGVLLASWPLVVFNAVSLILSAIILGLKVWMPSAPATDEGS